MSKTTVVLSVLLAVLPVAGQERRADAPIALYTSFQQPVPSGVFQSLQDELDDLMAIHVNPAPAERALSATSVTAPRYNFRMWESNNWRSFVISSGRFSSRRRT